MGDVKLSGSAFLDTGVIDLEDVGRLAQVIVAARHSFSMDPHKHEEGWRVSIQIDLAGEKSLALLRELKTTGHFDS